MKNKTNLIMNMMFMIVIVYTIIIYKSLPQQIPVHWNIEGEVNRYGAKANVFLFAVLPVLIYYLFDIIKLIDPKRKNYERFEKEYKILKMVLSLLMIGIYIIFMVQMKSGENVPMISTAIPVLIGLIFIVIGNYMPRFKQSFFVGIKTPWTLSNEEVWNKTHRLGGFAFVISGVLLVLCGLLDVNTVVLQIIFGVAIIIVLLTIPYSYIIYKRIKDNNE